MAFYRFIRMIVKTYLGIFNSWIIKGNANLPETGPVVLVSNHISNWDPLYLACSVKRSVHFMAKEELFRIPILGRIITALGTFPVKRGKIDRNSLRLAGKYLEKGEVLGIFPEGTRIKTGELGAFLHGAALFALRSGAPIVPMALYGTEKIFLGKIIVRIGEPLRYPELYKQKLGEEELQKVTKECREKIQELLYNN